MSNARMDLAFAARVMDHAGGRFMDIVRRRHREELFC